MLLHQLKELEQLHKEDQDHFSPIPFSGAGFALLPTYARCCVSERQKATVEAELTVCEIGNLAGLTDNIRSFGLNQGKLITRSSHCKQFRPSKCLISSDWSLNEIQLICCGFSLQYLKLSYMKHWKHLFCLLSDECILLNRRSSASCLWHWYLFFPFELARWVYRWVLEIYYSHGGKKKVKNIRYIILNCQSPQRITISL